MNEENIVAVLGVGVAYLGVLLPIAIIFIIFSFQAKKRRKNTMP